MDRVDITIAGAGVVGLAIAEELSKTCKDIFIIEKNPSFGNETSSRNSEVIHAGIYYPEGSLKAKTCVEGSRLIYEFCANNNIPHKKTGKLIVAVDDKEAGNLDALFKQGLKNGADNLKMLSGDEIKNVEPNIRAQAAIHSPSTGILDTHGFMICLEAQFKSRGGHAAYNTELTGIDKTKGGFKVRVRDKREGDFEFTSRIFINCAGLNSDKIAGMIGLTKDEYRLKYCKGNYFRVHNNKAKYISRLIYPVPKKDRAGLGIHATPDLSGGLRLGPDDEYVEQIDYTVDISKQKIFYEGVRQFLPFIGLEDISPDTAGVRPKLQGPGEGFRDFIIKDESEEGINGFINLIGIESPGLTSALSIAKIVAKMPAF